jgi:hypothetical protein
MLGLGVAGLIAFGRKFQNSSAKSWEQLSMPGDGTCALVNKTIQVLLFAGGFAAYEWWLRWARVKGVQVNENYWFITVASLFLVLILGTLHEVGHAAIGLALGMRLRTFAVGPFQWLVRDGKWSFEFNVRQILVAGGKTGIVPGRPNFPRWGHLTTASAGVFANLFTGILALWIASVANPDAAVQSGGLLALFGAWSLVVALINLVPFRTGNNYSDSAQIYHLLRNGAWADVHGAMSLAGSPLVTELRPRDYDIEAIRRAARTVNQGMQGLFLQLFAYSYFIDRNETSDAAEALYQAALIYNQSASDAPAELLTAFVFGSAYISRNASAARQWWTHMEARNPSRFNVDYWLAASALHWIEGNLKDAEEFWQKANALAQQLPNFGAYEFDRYCCALLSKNLGEAPVLEVMTAGHPVG